MSILVRLIACNRGSAELMSTTVSMWRTARRAAVIAFPLLGIYTIASAQDARSTDTPTAGTWVVQLGSFGEEQNARQLAERAETFGFTASVSTFTTNGRPIFRVRIGPTLSRESAAAIAELLTSNGFTQPWVLNGSEQTTEIVLPNTTRSPSTSTVGVEPAITPSANPAPVTSTSPIGAETVEVDTRSVSVSQSDISVAGAAERKTVQVVQVEQGPNIDGLLDDAIWSQAVVVEDFHQIEPNEYASPSERTQVYLLYDEEALYIGAKLWDSEPEQVTAHVMRQGTALWTEDTFTVIIDPLNDQRTGFEFQLNPNSVRAESQYQNVTSSQRDWAGIWHGESTRDAEGWVAEIAIPLKTLSFDPGNDQWGINFSRRISRKNERIGWVSRNREQDPSISGLMIGIGGLTEGSGLDIRPSISLGDRKDFSTAATTSSFEPSLDLFYKITPLLNGSLTLNTDFSATEVDDRQVNLTRFSLFFPEKREFFLKDADIFAFGRVGGRGGDPSLGNSAASRTSRHNGRPFFSRRIGLSGTGQPVDLDIGGKLTGRIGRWSVGTLAIHQAEFDDVEATDIFVGRASANVLAESSVGMIFTNGDPRSNLSNSVAGIDFTYLNTRLPGGRTLEGEAWYQQSDTEGLETDDAAFGFGARMPSRLGWRAELGMKQLEENFKPALGFVNNSGIRDSTLAFGYNHRFQNSFVRAISSGIDTQRIDLLEGDLQTEVTKVRVAELENNSSDELNIHYTRTTEALVEDFEISDGVTLPPGIYAYNSYGFELESGAHRRISGAFEYETGDFFEGKQLVLGGELTWRPSPHFRGSVGYEYNDIELPQGDFTTRLIKLETGISFSSRLSWVNLIQYDNVSDTMGIDSRLHWIPEAGREAFIVINHNLGQEIESRSFNSFHSTSSEGVVKLSYLFRF